MILVEAEFEVDLSDGEIALNQIGALPRRLSVGNSCVLREHPTGTPGLIYLKRQLNYSSKKSPVCDDKRTKGGEAVRAIKGGVRIGE